MTRGVVLAVSASLVLPPGLVLAEPTGISAPELGLRLTGGVEVDRHFAVDLAASGPATAVPGRDDEPEDTDPTKASSGSPVGVGDRVRVRMSGTGTNAVGEVLAVDDRVMTLVREEGSHLELPLGSITDLEVSRGTERMTKRGALIGAASGVAIAFGLLFLACDDCYQEEEFAAAFIVSSVTTGLVGAGIGALVGRSMEVDRWMPVERQRLGVHIVPVRKGVMAAVSVGF